jgi:hypothetical protein
LTSFKFDHRVATRSANAAMENTPTQNVHGSVAPTIEAIIIPGKHNSGIAQNNTRTRIGKEGERI